MSSILKEGILKTSLYIDEELHKDVKVYCVMHQWKYSEFVCHVLAQYLDSKGSPAAKRYLERKEVLK